jgi:hypothetical protein
MKNRASPTDRCQSCGILLGLELLRFIAITPDRRWTVCATCVRKILERSDAAHHEAGAILDEVWQLSPGGDGDPNHEKSDR